MSQLRFQYEWRLEKKTPRTEDSLWVTNTILLLLILPSTVHFKASLTTRHLYHSPPSVFLCLCHLLVSLTRLPPAPPPIILKVRLEVGSLRLAK
ncbi:unnamed protein product [Linum trigynum]|uniref:Uncharacterized protein n=1 Tax=Linum trigynum TaxID=586398 RepID=A0AAV2FCD2_9ROSI